MNYKILFLCSLLTVSFSCTDLEEELRDTVNREQATSDIQPGDLLSAAYEGLRLPYMDQSRWWAAQEHTGDIAIGPTRGPDWDDGGVWRVLHSHTWAPDHSFMSMTFGELLQVVYGTTNLLTFSPSAQQEAEARFLRAFVVLTVTDGWGQVPFRDAGTSLLENAQVLSAGEAIQLVIDEANAIISDLPDGPATVANKDAARVLLMKAYLNRGAYLNRQAPVFDNGDMQQVITLADQLISSGKYSLADNYFDNFAANNDQISTENIWTGENRGGNSSGNVAFQWNCTLHYNQNPSGWNGFTTLGDFYDSFDDSDTRRGMEYAGVTDVAGIRTGLLFGQQFDGDGNALQDRKGNPLAFTKEVALQESGNDLEITGIRVIKYPIDYVSPGGPADNDWVFYRYADVLLMKAEAALRTGDAGTALDIVNEIRTTRGAPALGSINLDELLAERGREFYWEGHRRTDLIRFGKFLDAWQNKAASSAERLLFPIPAQSLAANPNLVQNPGY